MQQVMQNASIGETNEGVLVPLTKPICEMCGAIGADAYIKRDILICWDCNDRCDRELSYELERFNLSVMHAAPMPRLKFSLLEAVINARKTSGVGQ